MSLLETLKDTIADIHYGKKLPEVKVQIQTDVQVWAKEREGRKPDSGILMHSSVGGHYLEYQTPSGTFRKSVSPTREHVMPARFLAKLPDGSMVEANVARVVDEIKVLCPDIEIDVDYSRHVVTIRNLREKTFAKLQQTLGLNIIVL